MRLAQQLRARRQVVGRVDAQHGVESRVVHTPSCGPGQRGLHDHRALRHQSGAGHAPPRAPGQRGVGFDPQRTVHAVGLHPVPQLLARPAGQAQHPLARAQPGSRGHAVGQRTAGLGIRLVSGRPQPQVAPPGGRPAAVQQGLGGRGSQQRPHQPAALSSGRSSPSQACASSSPARSASARASAIQVDSGRRIARFGAGRSTSSR